MLALISAGPPAGSAQSARAKMIDEQIRARGITNPAVLQALGKVPRERFVPSSLRDAAYDDGPLPIGHGQTISQPYIVAYMTEALGVRPGDHVLEIGTGSGYQAAVLGEIAREVYTIEIVPELAAQAKKTLTELGYKNVFVRAGNGYAGWPEKAPFDGIVVTAAAPRVPQALVDQLKPGGRMVIPVGGTGDIQFLKLLTKRADGGVEEKKVLPVRFVPLVPGK